MGRALEGVALKKNGEMRQQQAGYMDKGSRGGLFCFIYFEQY